MQVVTDFDLTLTKQHINGKHVLSSFGKQNHPLSKKNKVDFIIVALLIFL